MAAPQHPQRPLFVSAIDFSVTYVPPPMHLPGITLHFPDAKYEDLLAKYKSPAALKNAIQQTLSSHFDDKTLWVFHARPGSVILDIVTANPDKILFDVYTGSVGSEYLQLPLDSTGEKRRVAMPVRTFDGGRALIEFTEDWGFHLEQARRFTQTAQRALPSSPQQPRLLPPTSPQQSPVPALPDPSSSTVPKKNKNSKRKAKFQEKIKQLELENAILKNEREVAAVEAQPTPASALQATHAASAASGAASATGRSSQEGHADIVHTSTSDQPLPCEAPAPEIVSWPSSTPPQPGLAPSKGGRKLLSVFLANSSPTFRKQYEQLREQPCNNA